MNNFTDRIRKLSFDEKNIDRCLASLYQNEILNLEKIAYLANAHLYSNELLICLSLIVDEIMDAIIKGTLKRNDFDPFDLYHQTQKKSMQFDEENLDQFFFNKKCKVICIIADAFKLRCDLLVNNFEVKFQNAQSYYEVIDLRETALEQGILVEVNGELRHNHSIPCSKKIFQKLKVAISRVP